MDVAVGLFAADADAAGVEREYLHIEYAKGDRLYVPVDQTDRIARYSGGGLDPTLTRLGSGEWQQTRRRVRRAVREMALELVQLSAPPEVILPLAAERIIDFFLSEFGRRVFRICVAESDRFPELGQQFYESGPVLVRNRIAAYLTCAVSRGELVIDDIDLAADQFAELCKADIFSAVIFGVRRTFTEADRNRVITGAVEMFLARYRTGAS